MEGKRDEPRSQSIIRVIRSFIRGTVKIGAFIIPFKWFKEKKNVIEKTIVTVHIFADDVKLFMKTESNNDCQFRFRSDIQRSVSRGDHHSSLGLQLFQMLCVTTLSLRLLRTPINHFHFIRGCRPLESAGDLVLGFTLSRSPVCPPVSTARP